MLNEFEVTGSDQDTIYTDNNVTNGFQYTYRVFSLTETDFIGASNYETAVPRVGFENSLSFDGEDDYVEIPDSTILRNQIGTIEFWVKISTAPTGNGYSLLSKHDATASRNGWNFVHGNSELSVVLKNTDATRLNTNVNLIDSKWHHVALVYDVSGSNESILYIDGDSITSATSPAVSITDEPIRIGESIDTWWEDFNGQIDEIRIWDHKRTNQEILDNLSEAISGDVNGLTGLWSADESFGDTVYDNSPNGLDGTVVNATFSESNNLVGRIRFVTESGAGNMDGTSWENASDDLQAMINDLGSEQTGEVWVAEGTYYPDASSRTKSFELNDYIKVYGGFTGNESSVDQRDWKNNRTILSGDLDQNDTDADGDGLTDLNGQTGNNSYAVVRNNNILNTAYLDGFYITGGLANGDSPNNNGAAIFNGGSGSCSVVFENIVVSGNHAGNNGAVFNNETSYAVFKNSIFENNSADAHGAAIFNRSETSQCLVKVINSKFYNNSATTGGGAVFDFATGSGFDIAGIVSSEFLNCLFYDNSSVSGGGAIRARAVNNGFTTTELINCTITKNIGESSPGGLHATSGSGILLFNSILWNNDNLEAGGLDEVYAGSFIQYKNSIVRGSGGSSDWNASFGIDGGNNLDQDPIFADPDADFHLLINSPGINAGSNSDLPLDQNDLDGDENTTESLPFDLDRNPRIENSTVDLGPYEGGIDEVPTVSISSAEDYLTNSNPIPVTILFSEPVEAFDADDITLVNAVASNLTTTDSTEFNVDLIPDAEDTISVQILAEVVTDTTQNNNEASNVLEFVYDGTPPSVSITSNESDTTDRTNFPITLTFSEEITGFDESDINISGTPVNNLTTNDSIEFLFYTAITSQGLVEISISENVVNDLAGNGNLAADTFSIVYEINDAPEIISPINDLILNEGFSTREIDLTNIFYDDDMDSLSYELEKEGDTTAVILSIENDNLTITETGTGIIHVILTVDDGNGESVSEEFLIQVQEPGNTPPVIVTPLLNKVKLYDSSLDFDLSNEGINASVDVAETFSDPDSDSLSYIAFCEDQNVSITIDSTSIEFMHEFNSGFDGIVMASDGRGGIAIDTFKVYAYDIFGSPSFVLNPVSDIILEEGFETTEISTDPVFYLGYDHEYNTNEVKVGNTDSSVVSTELSGNTLKIDEQGLGTSTITLYQLSEYDTILTDEFQVIVTTPNEVPAVIGSLPDIELEGGFSSESVNIEGLFSDPDGDELTYTAVSSNESVATVIISNDSLVINEEGYGSTNITLIADDSKGGKTNELFLLDIYSLPELASQLPDIELEEGFGMYEINLNHYFDDSDGDVLSYTTSVQNEAIVTSSVSGSTLSINESSLGSTSITITANDDDGGSVEGSFSITVNEMNHPPTVSSPLEDIELNEDFSIETIDLSVVFSDENEDNLEFSAVSADDSVVTVSISGDLLRVHEEGIGSAQVTVTADDGNGGTTDDDFIVTVVEVNDAPVLTQPVDDQFLTEGFTTKTIDLVNVFSDEENDQLNFTSTSADENVVTVSMSGSILTITEQGVGNTSVTINVNDGNGGAASTEFAVNVNALGNNFPVVSQPIEDQEQTEGFETITIDLLSVFSDADDDVLSFVVSSSNENIVTVSISNNILSISEEGLGSSMIRIEAKDNNGGIVYDEFIVTVNKVNSPPEVDNALSDLSLEEGFGSDTLDLTAVFVDVDGDELSFTSSSDNESVVVTTISENLLIINEAGIGSANVAVAADDGNGGSISTNFDVVVNSQNSVPAISDALEDITLVEGFSNHVIDLSNVFTDADVDTLTLSATSSNDEVVSVAIDSMNLIVDEVGIGSAQITITANDGNGGEVVDTFTLTVEEGSVNNAPVSTGGIEDMSLVAGFSNSNIDLSGLFEDPENDDLVYSTTSSNTMAVESEVSGTMLTLSEVGPGTSLISIWASDGELKSDTISFSVTVSDNLLGTIRKEKFKIYPNPVVDEFIIQSDLDFRSAEVSLYDMDGREIKKFDTNKKNPDVSDIKPGVYLLIIEHKEKTEKLKLIKM